MLAPQSTGSFCYDISERWHRYSSAAVAAQASPASPFTTATSRVTTSLWHYNCSWNWAGELSWDKNNLFFCWIIFNSDQFPNTGHHVAAWIDVPGYASVFVGWKQKAGGGRKKAWLWGEATRSLLRASLCLSEQAQYVSSTRVSSQRDPRKALCCVVKTSRRYPRCSVLCCWFGVWESWMAEPLKPSGIWTKYLVTSFMSCFAHVVCTGFVRGGNMPVYRMVLWTL